MVGKRKKVGSKPATTLEESPGPDALPADKTLDSVAMVSRVLEELAGAPSAVGVTELARLLGESKARIHRFLASLKQHGLVDQEQATERYRLGWRLFQLGERAGVQFDLRRIADPYLKQLRDLTQQSALLSLPLNGEALVIASADNDSGVCITVKPGNRPAAHASAQGRIALAWATGAQTDRLLTPGHLRAFTPHSLTDPHQVRERVMLVRQRLWEEAPNEVLLGINVLAAPVLREGNELVGIIGIVGSIQDIPSPPAAHQLKLVQGAAAALSGMLGNELYQQRRIVLPAELRTFGSPR